MDEDKKTQQDSVPQVVKNQPDKKEERQKNYPSKLSFALGLVILIFAFIGIFLTAWLGITYLKGENESGSDFANYNAFLTPVAAVDPDPFDDITAADRSQLLGAAIWSILSADSTPDTYSYSGGYMLIPSRDVESAYMAIFGPETAGSLTHGTVQGYNCTFEYDSTALVYKIPVTSITPVYTPQVTEVKQSGSSLIVTVNYIASESWNADSEGNFVTPEPDKVMQITLRELQGAYFINAVQTASATVPETVSYEITTAPQTPQEENSSENIVSDETTTQKTPEKTTLGGNV